MLSSLSLSLLFFLSPPPSPPPPIPPSVCLSLSLSLPLSLVHAEPEQPAVSHKHGGWTSSTHTPEEFLRNGSLTSDCEIFSSRTLQRQVPGKWTKTRKNSRQQQQKSPKFRKPRQQSQISWSHWFFFFFLRKSSLTVSVHQKPLCPRVHSSSPEMSLRKSRCF